jgi:hypothetical protein
MQTNDNLTKIERHSYDELSQHIDRINGLSSLVSALCINGVKDLDMTPMALFEFSATIQEISEKCQKILETVDY